MTAKVIQIRDYHLRKLEREASEILSQVVDINKDGSFVVEAVPVSDPWAGRHCPGGIDDLV